MLIVRSRNVQNLTNYGLVTDCWKKKTVTPEYQALYSALLMKVQVKFIIFNDILAILNQINYSQYVLWIWCFLYFSKLCFLICSAFTEWKSCFAYYWRFCCESERSHVISSKSADCLNPCSILFHVLFMSCILHVTISYEIALYMFSVWQNLSYLFLKDAAAEREIVWNRNNVLNKQTQQREDHRLTAELGVSDRAVSQTVACQKVFSGDSLVHGLFCVAWKGVSEFCIVYRPFRSQQGRKS